MALLGMLHVCIFPLSMYMCQCSVFLQTGSKFDQAYDEKLELWPLKSNYSAFKRPYDAVCYDATYALAYALNRTIGGNHGVYFAGSYRSTFKAMCNYSNLQKLMLPWRVSHTRTVIFRRQYHSI